MLAQKQIVVELHQFKAPVVDPWARELAKVSDPSSNLAAGVDARTYLHIGDPVFSPWTATFKLLKRLRLAENDFGEIELEADAPT